MFWSSDSSDGAKGSRCCGIEFKGEPQGQGCTAVLDSREENQNLVLIKDIEQELTLPSLWRVIWPMYGTKWFGGIGGESVDKRAKFVRLTDKLRSQMK